ncbi:hypothetical protein SCLCIDRAFT_1221071 [Scleroderma citrinum Foug A]|uniref:DUF6533 domain-containing protein n=1 Tax=Scleroderma citrinum Foug A TaxID=1036808 RepID=A0A0C3DHG0_9AGAM|nr:hypothetical protein SCLCIDRAFT_1221071 [Scleroderma citrinum Foug A]
MLLDIGVCLGIVQLAIAYYDYFLTLEGEIELFWKKSRRSWPFALFVANRYVLVLGRLPTIAALFWKLPESVRGVFMLGKSS